MSLIRHDSTEVSRSGAEKARKDGRRAVKAFADAAIREMGGEPGDDETGGTTPSDET